MAVARARSGRVPGIGGRHGDDAECRGRAQPREPFEPRPRSRLRLRQAARRQRAARRAHGLCELGRGAFLAVERAQRNGGVLDGASVVPRDRGRVAGAPRRVRSGRRRSTIPSSARSGGVRPIGRRRSIVPTHRCAATCRPRLTAPSRSSSRASAIASRSTNGSSTACSRGTTRSTQPCSASDLPRACGRPTAKWTRWNWRSAAARCRRASCRRRRSSPSSRRMRVPSVGTAVPTSSPRLPSVRRAPAR